MAVRKIEISVLTGRQCCGQIATIRVYISRSKDVHRFQGIVRHTLQPFITMSSASECLKTTDRAINEC
jgi:hypothetical protein